MPTAYFRNCERIMSVLVEEGISHLSFSNLNLGRQGHDAITNVRQFYLHSGIRPKIMIIGPQGAKEYWSDGNIFEPVREFPVWSIKSKTFKDLEAICEKLYEEDDHMQVVISNCFPSNHPWWQSLFRFQRDFPRVKMYLSSGNSFNLGFGGRFSAADFEFTDPGFISKAYMPGGNRILVRNSAAVHILNPWSEWIENLGFTVSELATDKKKLLRFNIRSAIWASKHFADNYRYSMVDKLTVDATQLSENDYVPRSSHTIIARRARVTTKQAEKILCTRCSIAPKCKLFRSGSVCGLGESEMAALADSFQSRDAGRIVDGLAEIVKISATRFESAAKAEDDAGVVDPDVTRQAKSLFDMGTKLAKLVNPELAGPGVRVQVNVGSAGNAELLAEANPKKLMATLIGQFEAAGFRRDEITPDMLKGALEAAGRGAPMQQAITATAIATRDERKAEELKKAILEERVVNGEIMEPVRVPALPVPGRVI